MNTILVIMVFTALELFLSRRRRHWMSTEIEEALGNRDSLIESLQREITDKFNAVEFKAKQARADTRAAADCVDEIKLNADKLSDAVKIYIEELKHAADPDYNAMDLLNNKITRAEKQIGSNKADIADLVRKAPQPSLGEKPDFTLHPELNPQDHCHDGPTDTQT